MPHRRLVVALALTITLSLIALIVVAVPALSSTSSPAPVEPVVEILPASAPVLAPPPTDDGWGALRVEIKQQNDDRFYSEVARQTEEVAARKKAAEAAAPRTGRTAASPPAPRGSGSAEQAVAAWFGDIYDQAWGVSGCESGHDPGAISPGGGNWGLFQINTAHRDDFEAYTGHPWADVLDANLNAMYARKLYDGSGWRPWSCAWAA